MRTTEGPKEKLKRIDWGFTGEGGRGVDRAGVGERRVRGGGGGDVGVGRLGEGEEETFKKRLKIFFGSGTHPGTHPGTQAGTQATTKFLSQALLGDMKI